MACIFPWICRPNVTKDVNDVTQRIDFVEALYATDCKETFSDTNHANHTYHVGNYRSTGLTGPKTLSYSFSAVNFSKHQPISNETTEAKEKIVFRRVPTLQYREGDDYVEFIMVVPKTAFPGKLLVNIGGQSNTSVVIPDDVRPGQTIILVAPKLVTSATSTNDISDHDCFESNTLDLCEAPVAIDLAKECLTFLIVDSKPEIRIRVEHLIKTLTALQGSAKTTKPAQFLHANDGIAAVIQLHRCKQNDSIIHCVVIANEAGTMGGPDAVKIMRLKLGYKGVVVGVVDGGMSAARTEFSFTSSGADAVLEKPLQFAKLRAVLQHHAKKMSSASFAADYLLINPPSNESRFDSKFKDDVKKNESFRIEKFRQSPKKRPSVVSLDDVVLEDFVVREGEVVSPDDVLVLDGDKPDGLSTDQGGDDDSGGGDGDDDDDDDVRSINSEEVVAFVSGLTELSQCRRISGDVVRGSKAPLPLLLPSPPLARSQMESPKGTKAIVAVAQTSLAGSGPKVGWGVSPERATDSDSDSDSGEQKCVSYGNIVAGVSSGPGFEGDADENLWFDDRP